MFTFRSRGNFSPVFCFSGMILMSKKYTLCALVVSAILLSGCQSSGADYAADVYDTAQLNSKQETKTVNIISVLPAKVKVDNKANKERHRHLVRYWELLLGALPVIS
ncbi:outer membrane lipoprotein [Escherichia coli]|uniref:Outer membrane lipoprotein n=1 Tax=Escherichia coli TaxID=562 RepID=A0A376YJP9_ECOLX|nr:outer membrane lipoprotein [Escherichia coli]